MKEYEQNKKKIAEYRNRSNNWFLRMLCRLMELANEKCIKEDLDD